MLLWFIRFSSFGRHSFSCVQHHIFDELIGTCCNLLFFFFHPVIVHVGISVMQSFHSTLTLNLSNKKCRLHSIRRLQNCMLMTMVFSLCLSQSFVRWIDFEVYTSPENKLKPLERFPLLLRFNSILFCFGLFDMHSLAIRFRMHSSRTEICGWKKVTFLQNIKWTIFKLMKHYRTHESKRNAPHFQISYRFLPFAILKYPSE